MKRIIRYLKGTPNVGIRLAPTSLDITAYSDASHGNSLVGQHLITGCLIFIGGALIHWVSRKQKTIAHSSAEVEFVAMSTTVRDALWVVCLSAPTRVSFPITLLANNKSLILIANSEGLLRRIKHIEIQDLYVRSAQEKGIVNIEFVPGESNIADIMTKSVRSMTAYRLHCDHMCHGLWGSVKECLFTSRDP